MDLTSHLGKEKQADATHMYFSSGGTYQEQRTPLLIHVLVK